MPKCRKTTATEKSRSLIVEALYLDLKDLKQNKSDGERDRDRETDRQTVLLPIPFIKSLLLL